MSYDFARAYFADDRIERFPQLLHRWRATLVVALNNLAVASDSREAAEEALKIATEVARTDNSYHAKFILAFAAAQVARLTSRTDPTAREQKASEAHALASAAMVASKQLYDWAAQIAQGLQQESPRLEAELLKIESRKREIQQKLQAHRALERLASFPLTNSVGDPLCASCWMRSENDPVVMVAIESEDSTDLYRCPFPGCRAQHRVPI